MHYILFIVICCMYCTLLYYNILYYYIIGKVGHAGWFGQWPKHKGGFSKKKPSPAPTHPASLSPANAQSPPFPILSPRSSRPAGSRRLPDAPPHTLAGSTPPSSATSPRASQPQPYPAAARPTPCGFACVRFASAGFLRIPIFLAWWTSSLRKSAFLSN